MTIPPWRVLNSRNVFPISIRDVGASFRAAPLPDDLGWVHDETQGRVKEVMLHAIIYCFKGAFVFLAGHAVSWAGCA